MTALFAPPSPRRRTLVERRVFGLLLVCLMLAGCGMPAWGQVLLYPPSPAIPAEIAAVYGARSPVVGQDVNYRVRLAQTSPSPVEYYWDFGDGTLAEGNNAVHHYRQPGRYRLTVSVRNQHGSDAETLVIRVVAPPPIAESDSGATSGAAAEPPPGTPAPEALHQAALAEDAASRRPVPGLHGGAIQWNEGGYAWRMRTYFEYAAAEQEARRCRQAGYRVGIVRDASGPGSTVYRVVLGQFGSVEAALRAKRALPYRTGVLLMELAGVIPEPAGAPSPRP